MRPSYLDLDGYPSRTISRLCDDNPQSIPAAELTFENKPVIAMLISSETANCRYTFGDAIPDSTLQVGHTMFPGYILLFMRNSKAIRTFQFCNALAGQQQNAIMHITLFFEKQ